MSRRENERLLNNLVENLDLPDSAYEKAVKRYEDLGEWLGREESLCASNDPHIFPQGSFRLGIAIRPLSGEEEYDLDLACNLKTAISPNDYTQKDIKELVGTELELYRTARNIKLPLEAKHRCWRLEYADNLKFHMDIVPCIPEDEVKRKSLQISMESYGIQENLAKNVLNGSKLKHIVIPPTYFMDKSPARFKKTKNIIPNLLTLTRIDIRKGITQTMEALSILKKQKKIG